MLVEQDKALAHAAGDLREFVGLFAQLAQLRLDLDVLAVDALEQRRELLIGVVIERVLEIEAVERIDDAPRQPSGQQAGEDERLCHSLDGLGLPLGQRLGVGRASLHGGLDDARHLGAVVFPVELVGQPPVRQGGELPDDVPKAGGEHGHGGIL